ncbi:MAG: hypothetical protein KBF66_18535, partial [Rhodoferax sp.]|uniref:hypothetical protein n=1 Tax=Rhodoferax sp. TaxID=50421 RepID=UPI001B5B6A8B
ASEREEPVLSGSSFSAFAGRQLVVAPRMVQRLYTMNNCARNDIVALAQRNLLLRPACYVFGARPGCQNETIKLHSQFLLHSWRCCGSIYA